MRVRVSNAYGNGKLAIGAAYVGIRDKGVSIVPGTERQFMLRGLRGQGVFVDPKSKLVMVHTAAGGVGDTGIGERLSLWFGVVDSLAPRKKTR